MHSSSDIHFDADMPITYKVHELKNDGRAVTISSGEHEVTFYLRTYEQADVISGAFGAAWELEDVLFPEPVSDPTEAPESQERPSERAMRESEPERPIEPKTPERACHPYVRLDGSTWGCEEDAYNVRHTTPSNEPQTVDS